MEPTVTEPVTDTTPPAAPKPRSGLKTSTIVLLAILVTLVVAGGFLWWYLFSEFKPVKLSETEQQQFAAKVERIFSGDTWTDADPMQHETRRIDPYSESSASRRVRLTEREINSVIGQDEEVAKRLRVRFSPDLVTAQLLVPVGEDAPFMAGKTIRVNAGLELAYAGGHPVVKLRGVSVMGVAIPNSWLGGIKNVDLVNEFGDEGFWKAFAEGVEALRVRDGVIEVTLKE